MGDRALVVFKDANGYSPGVYLHQHGYRVPSLIAVVKALMLPDRAGDADYAAARFCGVCHGVVGGNLSLAIQNVYGSQVATAPADLSPGDAGCIVVDTNDDFKWKVYGGYLKNNQKKDAS